MSKAKSRNVGSRKHHSRKHHSRKHHSRRGQPEILKKWNEAAKKAGYGIAKKPSKKHSSKKHSIQKYSSKYHAIQKDAEQLRKQKGYTPFRAQKEAARRHNAYMPKRRSPEYQEIKRIFNNM